MPRGIPKVKKIEKECLWCKAMFQVTPSSNYRLYCSHTCSVHGRKVPRKTIECSWCNTDFEVYETSKRKYCSKTCTTAAQTGEGNPNFGNSWSQEQKDIASKRSLEWMEENKNDWEEINRNKTWTEEGKAAIAANTSKMWKGVPKPPTPDDVKVKIGKASAAKWTDEYKENHRKTMEEIGRWLPIDKKDPYELYRKESDWIQRMFDIVPDPRLLLESVGVYNAKNTKGCVRDHKFGRKKGFERGVFPEIIRHPANCEILLHSENISKAQKENGTYEASITLEQLFLDIESYKQDWEEQNTCLELINEYKKGNRYD